MRPSVGKTRKSHSPGEKLLHHPRLDGLFFYNQAFKHGDHTVGVQADAPNSLLLPNVEGRNSDRSNLLEVQTLPIAASLERIDLVLPNSRDKDGVHIVRFHNAMLQ